MLSDAIAKNLLVGCLVVQVAQESHLLNLAPVVAKSHLSKGEQPDAPSLKSRRFIQPSNGNGDVRCNEQRLFKA